MIARMSDTLRLLPAIFLTTLSTTLRSWVHATDTDEGPVDWSATWSPSWINSAAIVFRRVLRCPVLRKSR